MEEIEFRWNCVAGCGRVIGMSDLTKVAFFEKLAALGAVVFLPVGKGYYLLQEEADGTLRPAGGHHEKDQDANLTETIIRETGEEFGISRKEAEKKIKFLGVEYRRKFKGNEVFELRDHGLAEKTYQASNSKTERVKLVKAKLTDSRYTGPVLSKLKPRPLLKESHARDMDFQLNKQPDFVDQPPGSNPEGPVQTGVPVDPTEQMAKKKPEQIFRPSDPQGYTKVVSASVTNPPVALEPGYHHILSYDQELDLPTGAHTWHDDGKLHPDTIDGITVHPDGPVNIQAITDDLIARQRDLGQEEELEKAAVIAVDLSEFEFCDDVEVDEFVSGGYGIKSASELEQISSKFLPKYWARMVEAIKSGKSPDYLFRGENSAIVNADIRRRAAELGKTVNLRMGKSVWSPFYSNGVTHASPFPSVASSYGYPILPEDGKALGLKLPDNRRSPSVISIYRNHPDQGYFPDPDFNGHLYGADSGEPGLRLLDALKKHGPKGLYETNVTPNRNKFLGWGLYYPHNKQIRILRPEHLEQLSRLPEFAGFSDYKKYASTEKAAAIAVDLDGCLAHKEKGPFDPEHIGEPVPAMLERVKKWIKDGKEVAIFTARATTKSSIPPIKLWLKKHGLGDLEITATKHPKFEKFFDDRAIGVKRNTGELRSTEKVASDIYQESPTSTFTHDGKDYNLNQVLQAVSGRPVDDHSVEELKWVLDHTDTHPARINAADTNTPVLVTNWNGKKTVVDGAHRLAKAIEEGRTSIPGRMVGDEDLQKAASTAVKPAVSGDTLSEKQPTISDNADLPEDQIPRTGPEAIAYALQHVDLDQKEAEAHDIVRKRLRSKRPGAVQVLGVIQGLRRSGIKPGELMIHQVPVIPPQFRPYTVAGDNFIPGDANELYRDLINLRDLHGDLEQKLGVAGAASNKLRIYDAAKALYGFGEPTSPKTRERNVSGFLNKIVGDNPKHSQIQRKLLSRNVDFAARSVLAFNPDLGMDEIDLPDEMAWKLYSPYIQRRLVRGGMTPSQAIKHVGDRTQMADKALDVEMAERPVMYSRAPAWHKFSILGGFPRRVKGNAININPFVATGLGADADGDSGRFLLYVKESSCVVPDSVSNSWHMLNRNNKIKVNEKLIHISGFPHIEDSKKETGPGVIEYDVPPGVVVYGLHRDTLRHGWMPVTKFSVHENLEMWQVDLSEGKTIFTSADHSLVGYRDGKLELVKPAESKKVCIPRVKNSKRMHPPIEHVVAKGKLYDQEVEFKLKLDYRIGQWLGMVIGDGQTNDNCVCLSGKGDKAVNRALFSEIIKSDALPYGGHVGFSEYVSPSLSGRNELRQRDVVSDQRWFTNWIRAHIGRYSLEKRIPDFSMNASEEHLWGLFDGLMSTDGTICISHSKKKPQLQTSYSTSSVDLVACVQSLLTRLDVRSSVTPYKSRISDHDAFIINISTVDLSKQNSKREIRFNHPAKDKIFRENIATVTTTGPGVRGDQVPFPCHLLKILKMAYADRTGFQKRSNGKTNYGEFDTCNTNRKWDRTIAKRELALYRDNGGTWTQEFEDYQKLIDDTTISWDIVVSAAPLSDRMTGWDITVPDAFTFALDDGTIVQDTMNIHLPSTASAVDDVKTKLMPSKMLWSIKNREAVVPALKQEQVLGLYQAQKRPAKNVHQFPDEATALKAINSGAVRMSDEIKIG